MANNTFRTTTCYQHYIKEHFNSHFLLDPQNQKGHILTFFKVPTHFYSLEKSLKILLKTLKYIFLLSVFNQNLILSKVPGRNSSSLFPDNAAGPLFWTFPSRAPVANANSEGRDWAIKFASGACWEFQLFVNLWERVGFLWGWVEAVWVPKSASTPHPVLSVSCSPSTPPGSLSPATSWDPAGTNHPDLSGLCVSTLGLIYHHLLTQPRLIQN